ncbi:hypothetical protein, conserved [Eimeria acervulina]|uniref:Uncharacterized protein n=1 Tax=Eimeria acervulina TaxID=5801 RepID=U6GFY2_EIMAC|nr:hypothetical protein, conserved [Eimeria acervulina]CDI79146.1 hypothetical protein, conserved [Eimeria acervulina]
MDCLWPWLLLVAAVEVAGVLAGGSIGLAEPTTESETTSSTWQSRRPFPSTIEEELPVLGGHPAFARVDTETALSWEDATKASVSFPCTTCTTVADETASVQEETAGSFEVLQSNPDELPVEETSPVAAAAVPLRGLKSLILSSLLLGVLLLIVTAPDEVYNEDNALVAWRHFFAEEMIDGMFAIDDFLDAKAPVFPFKIFSFWMLAGAVPMMFVSGLVNVVQSIKRRRQGLPLLQGPRVSGLTVSLMAALLSVWVMLLPVYRSAGDYEGHLLEEVSVNIAWGVNIACLSLLLL